MCPAHPCASRAVYRRLPVILLTLAFFTFCTARAAAVDTVEVARDGSLIFQEPDTESAVLDILDRGTRLQRVESIGDWCKVNLSDNSRTGYIRKEAVTAPGKEGATHLEPAATPLESLQRSLDESEAKLRQAQMLIDNIEKMIERQEPTAGKKQSRKTEIERGKSPKSGSGTIEKGLLEGSAVCLNLFSGFYFKDSDFSAGGSIVCSPGFMKDFSLELEGGVIIRDSRADRYSASLSILYPAWKVWGRLRPYLSLGAGVQGRRIKKADRGTDTEINPLASLGLGTFVELAGSLSLRADLRSVAEFRDSGRKFAGRFYLALSYRR